jgi:hypothetical protein
MPILRSMGTHTHCKKFPTCRTKEVMDAMVGKNMEAFLDSDDEDESCDSDGDAEDDNNGDGSDGNDGGDGVSAAVVDRGYTEQDYLDEEDLAFSDDEADLYGGAATSLSCFLS